MIRAQRVLHRLTWVVIALLSTPVLVLALTHRPERPRIPLRLSSEGVDDAIGVAAATASESRAPKLAELGVNVTLANVDGDRELVISVESSFALPETLVYAARSEASEDAPPSDARLLWVASPGRTRRVRLAEGEDRLLLFCLPRQEIVATDLIDAKAGQR